MEKARSPFCIFKRKDKPCFYVRFKNEKTGEYLLPKSTGQTDKTTAIKTAWEWYNKGIPQNNGRIKVVNVELINTIKTTLLDKTEIQSIVKVLKQQGYIKSAILTGDRSDKNLVDYLLEFWDYDRSPYVKEKLRRNHSIHRAYCLGQYNRVVQYLNPVFANHLLGEITRQDIDTFVAQLDNVSDKSARTKNAIIQTFVTPLKYAYQKGLIDNDVTQGITYFSGKPAERRILTPEQVTALFAIEWTDNVAKLANLLACLTGMRVGEILGLRWQDLGENCLYVRHSWNNIDGLKPPKNGETRTVQMTFAKIMYALRSLAQSNPHGQGLSGFVFYSDTIPNQPFDQKILIKKLRTALQTIGMSEVDSKKYTFHSWRHFYTSYMRDKITDKLLQSQTGHKSNRMLKHYSNHTIDGDTERIQQAQATTFSGLLPETINTNFDLLARKRDAHGRYTVYNQVA
ncbi:integrase [Candidatus Termititenax persephonae]|uniref:Integrase n=1 Tax=Candidatus Termititenax persephonae TaxID=2218525 RepID=A0A388TIE9_9BACT|nr:integrase [Candidatus Termititenax persephonae]